jgi:hypothetical protein
MKSLPARGKGRAGLLSPQTEHAMKCVLNRAVKLVTEKKTVAGVRIGRSTSTVLGTFKRKINLQTLVCSRANSLKFDVPAAMQRWALKWGKIELSFLWGLVKGRNQQAVGGHQTHTMRSPISGGLQNHHTFPTF